MNENMKYVIEKEEAYHFNHSSQETKLHNH